MGAGGTGGCIGGLLASNNNDVSFIARGKNLEQLKQKGIKLKTGVKGEIYLPKIKAFSAEEYMDKADVIFVCVKTYSIDDVIPLIKKASHENTIIIPTANGFGIGEKISQKIDTAHVLDGCIYVSAFIDSPGSVTQLGKIIRVVFGVREGDSVDLHLLNGIRDTLCSCGIDAVVSDNIRRDTFKKFTFISSFASCGAYYNINAGEMQKEGKYRDTFRNLCEEIKQIGDKLELGLDIDITETNLNLLDSFPPDTTASMQKDMKEGKMTEMDGLVFEVVRLGEKLGVEVPVYSAIAKHFGYTNP